MQNLKVRRNISDVENRIKKIPTHMDGDCFPLKHSIVDGLYVREIYVPAGYLIVTKLFKQAHATFLMMGDVSILTEDGVKRIKGPCNFMTKVGTKRIIYVHEDTIWVTVHQNPKNLRNLEQLEEDIIAKDYSELDEAQSKFIESFAGEMR